MFKALSNYAFASYHHSIVAFWGVSKVIKPGFKTQALLPLTTYQFSPFATTRVLKVFIKRVTDFSGIFRLRGFRFGRFICQQGEALAQRKVSERKQSYFNLS